MMIWLAAAMAAMATAAPAQTFPERTVKLVVPVPPGGSTDAVSRLLTARLQAILGQPVIIENQPGAGGVIAARAVAAAKPDGYTLLIGGVGTLSIGPAAKSPDFNAATAFTPVAAVSAETMVLVVNPKVPAENLDAFVRYARMAGGKLNYGSAPGIAPHFVSELFRLKTGTDIVHIPYKGAGPVITDLLAGQIDMAFNNKSVLLQLVKQGRLRPLAVTSATRGGRNCPRSRPWSRPASFRIRSKPGGASSGRPACRGRSSSASTARSTQPCNPRSCARALQVSASSRAAERRNNSPP